MSFPEEAMFWTDDADGDPVLANCVAVSGIVLQPGDAELIAALTGEFRARNTVEARAAATPPFAFSYWASVAVEFLRRKGYLVVPPIAGPPGEHDGLR